MNVPYAVRPGGGFVLLVSVVLGAISFFAWGLSAPDLDRVWKLENEIKLGQRDPLTKEELRLVQDVLCRHPDLAEDWPLRPTTNDRGYAYLVRAPETTLVVSPDPAAKSRTIDVRARTSDDALEGSATEDVPFTWSPRSSSCPTLIEVVVTDGKKKKRSARVQLKAAP